jgi:hypothetical protein
LYMLTVSLANRNKEQKDQTYAPKHLNTNG